MANGTVQLLLKALQAKLNRSVASHKPIAKLPHLAAESPCRVLGIGGLRRRWELRGGLERERSLRGLLGLAQGSVGSR